MVTIVRKITQQAVNAFIAGQPFNSSNTSVVVDGNQVDMLLHGNRIARSLNGIVYVSNAGWSSNTTKERLNGILDTLNVSGIYQRDWVWYWKDGEEFPHNEFVRV